MVSFGSASGRADPVPSSTLVKGPFTLVQPALFNYIKAREDLEKRSSDVFKWIIDGKLKMSEPVVVPLADVKQAHDIMESRGTSGKILIRTT